MKIRTCLDTLVFSIFATGDTFSICHQSYVLGDDFNNTFVWSSDCLWLFFYAYVCSCGFFVAVHLKVLSEKRGWKENAPPSTPFGILDFREICDLDLIWVYLFNKISKLSYQTQKKEKKEKKKRFELKKN